MPDFFHVSHAPGRTPIPSELNLRMEYPWLPRPAEALISEWYPDGLTQHGSQYLADPRSDGGSRTIELLWELTRRAEFPDRRSRMTSVFAMATLEDALAFRAEHRAGFHAGVWRVQAECAHRGNMKLVSYGATGATAIQNARSYWRGDRGEASELWECLLVPPVRVTEQVA